MKCGVGFLVAQLGQVIGNGMHLPFAGARCNHKIVAHRGKSPHVQHDNIVATGVRAQTGGFDGKGSCDIAIGLF